MKPCTFQKPHSIWTFYFSLALLFSCASVYKPTVQIEEKMLDIGQLPNQEAYPDAGALIITHEANIDVFQNEQMNLSMMEERLVIKVFNEKGYKYANVLIPYDSFSQISDIRARTILPDGQSVSLSKDKIFDTNLYPEFIFYSDFRAKRFTMPAVENGCILDYRWKKTVDNFTFWTRWQFQQDEPVLLSKYTVRCPNTWDIRWKTYGVSVEPQVESAMKGMKVDHVWKVENIPAFVPEAGMPPGNGAVMSILFSPVGVKTWDDIAGWFMNLAKDRFQAGDDVKKETASLLQAAITPREKLQRILEFVRDHIRYIAIEIGIGGFQPHDAGSVLTNHYGDCKDMVALIISMARSVNIQVDPVLIPTWHHGELDSGMVSQAHFNHLIARAVMPDSSEIWMDPTEKTCAFGNLPWYDQNRLALIVSREGRAEIRRTPKPSQHENGIQRHWTVRVDTTGKADGSLSMILRGIQASEIRYLMKRASSKSIEEWLGRELLARFPAIHCENVRIRNQNNLNRPLEIESSFSEAIFCLPKSPIIAFQPGSLAAYDWNRIFPEIERKYPIRLQYSLEITDFIDLTVPVNWKVSAIQTRDSVETLVGRYSYRILLDKSNKMTYQRYFCMDSTAIDASQFNDFRTFLNQVSAKDKNTLIFTR